MPQTSPLLPLLATTALLLTLPARAAEHVRSGKLPDAHPTVVASGTMAGGYAAFPDLCRTRDGRLYCVFYSGYAHVSNPKQDWDWGGRIMAVTSEDEGRTWSRPRIIMDTPHDDRDPHVSCMKNGDLVLSWFSAWDPAHKPANETGPVGIFTAVSRDGGQSWSPARRIRMESKVWWACSAPVRELKDGTWILGIYHQEPGDRIAWGGTIRSHDRGLTWSPPVSIGESAGLQLDAETDVVEVGKGKLIAALRSSQGDMYFSRSRDNGKTWSAPTDSGFPGHSPIFLRKRNGVILLGHRLPNTALHWSTDDGKTWRGPVEIDAVRGAYPGLAELDGGDVYCVYYEEGAGSSIRGIRLHVDHNGVMAVRK